MTTLKRKTAIGWAVISSMGIILATFQNCGQTPGNGPQGEISQQSSTSGLIGQDPGSSSGSLTPSPPPMPVPQPTPVSVSNPNPTLLDYTCREGNNVLICLGPNASHVVAEYSVRTKYNIAVPISCYFVKEHRESNLFCAREPYPYAMQYPGQVPIFEPIRTYFTTPLKSRCGTHFTSYSGPSAGSRGIDVVCQSQGVDLQNELAYLQGRFANMIGGGYGSLIFANSSLNCRIGLHFANPVVGPAGFDYITCSGVLVPVQAN